MLIKYTYLQVFTNDRVAPYETFDPKIFQLRHYEHSNTKTAPLHPNGHTALPSHMRGIAIRRQQRPPRFEALSLHHPRTLHGPLATSIYRGTRARSKGYELLQVAFPR